MLKAVLDTNIIISGLNFSGSPARVLELVAKGEIQNLTSQDILYEVQGVLLKKMSWEKEQAEDAIRWLRLVSEITEPQEKVCAVSHDPDNRIIECVPGVASCSGQLCRFYSLSVIVGDGGTRVNCLPSSLPLRAWGCG